jgi:hypothetical protein
MVNTASSEQMQLFSLTVVMFVLSIQLWDDRLGDSIFASAVIASSKSLGHHL